MYIKSFYDFTNESELLSGFYTTVYGNTAKYDGESDFATDLDSNLDIDISLLNINSRKPFIDKEVKNKYSFAESKKITIDDLTIEITRKCNLSCSMCLRGESQNKDFDIGNLKKLLQFFNMNDDIFFTGGEPLLNLNGILEVCKLVKNSNIRIISNGDVPLNNEAIKIINSILDNVHSVEIAISNTKYHQKCRSSNFEKNKEVIFNSFKKKLTYWNPYYAENLNKRNSRFIKTGRGGLNIDENIKTVNIKSLSNIVIDCDGNLFVDSNHLDYENIDKNKKDNINRKDFDVDSFISKLFK